MERKDSEDRSSRSTTADSSGVRLVPDGLDTPRSRCDTALAGPPEPSLNRRAEGSPLDVFSDFEYGGETQKTTVIIRNLPEEYTRTALLNTLVAHGFAKWVNFLYLPLNFGTNSNFGYAFINFSAPEDALRFMADFQGFSDWLVPSANSANVAWSDERQGLEAQIERYRNSSMMHKSVADEAKPILLQDGVRIGFPSPARAVKPMRVRAWKRQQVGFAGLATEVSLGAT